MVNELKLPQCLHCIRGLQHLKQQNDISSIPPEITPEFLQQRPHFS